MKLVILAGGMGQRLSRRTVDVPKPMIQIGSQPIIWHIMKYYAHFGINEFIICLGYKGDVIRNYFANYKLLNSDCTIDYSKNELKFHHNFSEQNWKVTLVDTGTNSLKGSRIKQIEKYLDDDINLLTYSDGLSDININELINYHKKMNKIVTISSVNPPSRFGEITEKNGLVQSFNEKSTSMDRLINGGFMVFDKKLLNYLTTDEQCDFERDILKTLATNNQIASYKHLGNWMCMDNEADAIELNNLYQSGKAFWKKW